MRLFESLFHVYIVITTTEV